MRAQVRSAVVAMAVCGLMVVGCGGGSTASGGTAGSGSSGASGSSGTSGTGATADQAATDLARVLCERLNTCFPFVTQLRFGDVATCQAREKLSLVPRFAAPGTGATPDRAEACAAATSNTSCADLRSNVTPATCDITGTLANGVACGDGNQCQSSFCKITPGSGCGVCAPKSGAGGACVGGQCTAGLVCASSICVTPSAAGAACSASQPCQEGLFCNGGTCAQASSTPGATCNSSVQGSCDRALGLICNGNNVCANIQLTVAGNPCGGINGGLTLCSASGVCAVPSGASTGTCAATADDGQTCDPTHSLRCLSPARCLNGTCALPNPSACQ